jgi:hypothetical protein
VGSREQHFQPRLEDAEKPGKRTRRVLYEGYDLAIGVDGNDFDLVFGRGEKDGDLRAKGMAKSPGYVRLALMRGIGDMKLPFYSYSACMMFVSGEDYYTPKRSSFLYYKKNNFFSASHIPSPL